MSNKGVGVRKFLFVIALAVLVSCSNNGSSREATDTHDAAVPQLQSENIEPSDAAMTTANLKGVAVAREAALAGAEVGCAALAQMVALTQEATQAGGKIQDASWLAVWKTVREL